VAWNKLAEICNQWLSKGSRVYVEGRMQTRQWQDQEGQTRYQTEVIAIDIIILDSRRDGTPAPLDDTPVAIDDTSPRPPAAPARARATSSAAPPRAAKVTTLPRGKDAFAEEDLPF
jgi:single-strand DNA-binding protein